MLDHSSMGLEDDLDDPEIQLRPFDASSVRHAINDLEDVFNSPTSDFADLEAADLGDQDSLLLAAEAGSLLKANSPPRFESNSSTTFSWMELGFYQRFFDVRTHDVLARSVDALLVRRFRHDVDNLPDLYGPLWISTTIILLLAATANLASYLHAEKANKSSEWRYDFDQMTGAAMVFYSVITIFPLAVWLGIRYLGVVEKRLVSVVSIYGYSLVAFIPATVIFVFNSEPLSWLAVLVSWAMSTTFLIRNLWSLVSSDDGISRTAKQKQHSLLLVLAIVVAHLVLSLVIKMFFTFE